MISLLDILGFVNRTTEVRFRDQSLQKDQNLVGSAFEDAVAGELAEQSRLDEEAAATRLEKMVVTKPVEAVDTKIRPAKKPVGPIRAFQCPVGMTPEEFALYSQYEGMTQARLEKIANGRKGS